jgi:hypothetical protein
VVEFAADFDWAGIASLGFWPLLLLVVGIGIAIRTVSREAERRSREEASHE